MWYAAEEYCVMAGKGWVGVGANEYLMLSDSVFSENSCGFIFLAFFLFHFLFSYIVDAARPQK